mmetsp:Transcript_34294/g.73087  ORF Transcript_34294/g.73087 Transcript_34294/m.73087 type:complete len:242 (-) Transcript_34294:1287-2012(-)
MAPLSAEVVPRHQDPLRGEARRGFGPFRRTLIQHIHGCGQSHEHSRTSSPATVTIVTHLPHGPLAKPPSHSAKIWKWLFLLLLLGVVFNVITLCCIHRTLLSLDTIIVGPVLCFLHRIGLLGILCRLFLGRRFLYRKFRRGRGQFLRQSLESTRGGMLVFEQHVARKLPQPLHVGGSVVPKVGQQVVGANLFEWGPVDGKDVNLGRHDPHLFRNEFLRFSFAVAPVGQVPATVPVPDVVGK